MEHLKTFENFQLNEAEEKPYTCDVNKGIVYSGKNVIAMVVVNPNKNGRSHELKTLQGTPTSDVMKKILKDCPEFCKEYDFDEKYYPTKRLSEETAKKYKKKKGE